MTNETLAEINGRARRRINNVWEYTQAVIAAAVVLTTCGGVLSTKFVVGAPPFPAEWWAIVGLVIGFYFGRTNHTRPSEGV